MTAVKHNFVIPGLFHLGATDLDFMSDEQYLYLAKFITSSKRLKTSTYHLDGVLCQQLVADEEVLPIAQHFKNEKNVLIATPITLKADINSTWIQPALNSDNIQTIMADMAEFFSEDLTIIEHCEDHFIIHFKLTDVVKHLPNYLTVLGKKIDLYQQSIRDNLDWFKLVNEIQMFLHGHALNKTDTGQQIFNSLWFWGGDSTKTLQHSQRIRCDDGFLQLALSNDADQTQDKVTIKTDLIKYLKLNSNLELEAFFYQLDQELKDSKLSKVTIDTADGYKLVYDFWSKFKFWQKKTTLLNFFSQAE